MRRHHALHEGLQFAAADHALGRLWLRRLHNRIEPTAAGGQVWQRGALGFRRRGWLLAPSSDLVRRSAKGCGLLQLLAYLAQRLEQLALLVDPVRMKIVQSP